MFNFSYLFELCFPPKARALTGATTIISQLTGTRELSTGREPKKVVTKTKWRENEIETERKPSFFKVADRKLLLKTKWWNGNPVFSKCRTRIYVIFQNVRPEVVTKNKMAGKSNRNRKETMRVSPRKSPDDVIFQNGRSEVC